MPVSNGSRLKMIITAVAAMGVLVAIGMGPADTNWGAPPDGSAHATQAAVIQQSVPR
jgi:hypothetical protein